MKRLNQKEEIGKTYGRLTIKKFVNPEEHSCHKLEVLCECNCGREKITKLSHLRSGNVRSCGCMLGDNNRKHDLTREHSRLVYVWEQMMRRCYNHKATRYSDYGGRGISVCKEWHDIKIFSQWMFEHGYKDGTTTLDRIDCDKGYCPENCRIADKFTQAANKRKKKSNTSGYVGVKFNKRAKVKRWTSDITVRRKRYFLGYFLTKEEALDARNNYIINNNLTDFKIQEWEG